MQYLSVKGVSKNFTGTPLFSGVDFFVNKGDKAAIVAQNGGGKSTLLNMIFGNEEIVEGKVELAPNIKIGILEQKMQFQSSHNLIDAILDSDETICQAVTNYEIAVNGGDYDMEKAIEEMNNHNAWDFESRIKSITNALGLSDLTKNITQLSGGQQKRIALAKVLIHEPDFLILDEPTNHLDLQMIDWLENFLKKQNSTLLMITHDRYFLERVCNKIFELTATGVRTYDGNYSYHLEKKAELEEMDNIRAHKLKQQYRREISRMRQGVTGRGTKLRDRQDNFYELEKKYKADKYKPNGKLEINIKQDRIGGKVLKIHNLCKSFEDKKVIENFSYDFANSDRIGIIGKNGAGKSTLLNIITGKLEKDSGKMNYGQTINIGYFDQQPVDFSANKRIIEVVKEISSVIQISKEEKVTAGQMLEYFMFPSNIHHKFANTLSGGEKKRLYLLTILMKNPNFLILDEPTNDLDIVTINVLEEFLLQFKGTLIIVSHDRYFMDKVVNKLFLFEGEGKIEIFDGDYSTHKQRLKDKEIIEEEKKKADKKEKLKENQPVKQKLSYDEKKEFRNLENQIEKLEEQKLRLMNEFSNPIAQSKIQSLSVQLDEIVKELENKEARWMELSEKME